jgi:protein-S-isoprenylcysteine O-methyltransferase Ste14
MLVLSCSSPSRLATEGLYSRVRHPRYLQLLLALLGYALFANYLAAYVVTLLAFVWVRLVVPVEERELRERFGEEHTRYCERVPRFIPTIPRHRPD